jgi:hypothetical protein
MFPAQNTEPSRYPPLTIWGLIAVNCAIFLVQIRLPPVEADALITRFALIPARYCCGNADLGPADFLPFFTMIFLHGGCLHLILNMWALGGVRRTRRKPVTSSALSSSLLRLRRDRRVDALPVQPHFACSGLGRRWRGHRLAMCGCSPFRGSSLSFPSCFSRSSSMLQRCSLSESGS